MKSKIPPEHIQFCDLSSHLDRSLSLLARLAEIAHSEHDTDENLPELGLSLSEYLGKRVVLEHVFFGRCIPVNGVNRLYELSLKAELWKVRKMKASAALVRKVD